MDTQFNSSHEAGEVEMPSDVFLFFYGRAHDSVAKGKNLTSHRQNSGTHSFSAMSFLFTYSIQIFKP